MHNGFQPFYNENSEILILGSFPSIKSRENGFYYGNKQNRFWRMLERIFEEKIEDNIPSKKVFLTKHKIALYDVIIESDLKGSADSDLICSQHKIAEFEKLFPPFTKIQKILCNGKAAYNLFIANYKIKMPVLCMPSTSSANPRYDINVWTNAIKNA